MNDQQNIKWYAITNYHPKKQIIKGSGYGNVTWEKWCHFEAMRINTNPNRIAIVKEPVNESKVEKCCIIVNVTLAMDRFRRSKYGQRNIPQSNE